MATQKKPPVIRIRADQTLQYQQVIRLMNLLMKNNLSQDHVRHAGGMTMHARAPTAFMLSLTLHIGVVLAIVALAFVVQHKRPAPVQIFELVAGPPTDLTATEAPALGSPEGRLT